MTLNACDADGRDGRGDAARRIAALPALTDATTAHGTVVAGQPHAPWRQQANCLRAWGGGGATACLALRRVFGLSLDHTGERAARGGRWPGAIVLALLVCLAAGCTTVSRSTSESIALLFHRQQPPTAARVAALPYPQLWLQAPDLRGTLVLAHVDGDRQAWFAGHEAVFYLRPDGLVSGFTSPRLRVEARILSGDPFAALPLHADLDIRREYDWMPGYRAGVVVSGRLHRVGIEQVTILGHVLTLARYEERLRGPGLAATNVYWVDEDRHFVWKSRQTLAPGYTVEITQLKPYRPAPASR